MPGQQLHHAQASRFAARALLRIDLRHPLEKLKRARSLSASGRKGLASSQKAFQHPPTSNALQTLGCAATAALAQKSAMTVSAGSLQREMG